MIKHLWQIRFKPPFPSKEWFRTWAKRVQQAPMILRHAYTHARLRHRKADIAPTCCISSIDGISGDLANLRIGKDSFVGRVEIAVHASVDIGEHVCINDGVKLLTASHDTTDSGWATVCAPVKIHDYAWVGTNALVLPGVTIGTGAVVGAGAVVAKDLPAYAIAVGNPARLLEQGRCRTFNYSPVARTALFTAWHPLDHSPGDH